MTVRRIPTKRGEMTTYYKVDLDGKAYTYGWTGSEPLKAGDTVEVPGNVVNPKPSVRRVLRVLAAPDYDVDKIVNILSKVEPPSRPEPHDWDDLIGDLGDTDRLLPDRWDDPKDDDTAVEKFEDYVAEKAHAARERRNDDWVTYGSMGGMDPSADDLPEDAARMMQARYADALPDDVARMMETGGIGEPEPHEEGDRS